ncbi:MAG: hypothetical protein M1818_002773 [Claussenomyces sp. TS43310]|nr:MAG: hypothetical protein M1818_002773 [Claussenomyces sp. TS43310]
MMALAAITVFLVKLLRHRRRMLTLRKQGLPMPPYNAIFGHLLFMANIARKLPSDSHGHYLPTEIRRALPELPPIFYLDIWPMGPPLLVITSASGAYQIAQENSLPKHDDVLSFLQPLVGKHGLVTMEGDEWKFWRSIFNSGFNMNHLLTLVPSIVDDTRTYCEVLREWAGRKEIFPLLEATSMLTMDMSGRATLGTRLNAQRSRGGELVSAFRSQAKWMPAPNESIFARNLNPIRSIIYRYNLWRMDRFLSHELDNHPTARRESTKVQKSRVVIDLALENYLCGSPKKTNSDLDATFKTFAMSQIKLFIFAGYDTTAATAIYAIHLLSRNPLALQRLVEEHASIFGSDLSKIADLIIDQPQLVNRLPYTSAVIKETLRLYPPVSNTRKATSDFSLVSADGTRFPTDGFLLWGVHYAIHHSTLHWPSPEAFLPQRWLTGPEDPLYPAKDAWRPFEKGPRNCIGQELALLEIRIILVMVMREFEVKEAYMEWDTSRERKDVRHVNGDRAYQVLLGSTKPRDGYPCRVKVREE